MSKKLVWWILGTVAMLFLGAALWGPIASNVEHPKYTVAERRGNIEIRDYAPMIVAETVVKGERLEAIGEGFRTIADYIFGNNTVSQKIPMTAPVTQQSSEKIAMSAPVTQQGGGHTWHVRFIMPSKYTIETIPKPNSPAIELKEIPAKRFAVIRFSGMAREEVLKRYSEELAEFLRANGLSPVSPPTYAFYNPPWTLPFLRRNEVLVEVASPSN